jgi:hypothetical protein
MAFTCLQIIQQVCGRLGIPQPNSALSSTDQQIIQLLALSNAEGQNLASRYPFQELQTEATFTTVATQLQGSMNTLASNWNFVLNDTIWNRTLRRPVYGARTPQQWQQALALTTTSPYSMYRIRANNLYFYPVPAAGNTCAFEYITQNWVATSTSSVSNYWTNDADTSVIRDDLIILGTVSRWKRAKGLDYSEEQNEYDRILTEYINRNGTKQDLNLTQTGDTYSPVVIVPAGSWMQ